ncbi:hypothetical protein HWV62_39696 [Athelia sp. TMB]|nr:hypothetical protein HWV62_39696 [Athelia sp. TMB]
MPTTNDSGHTVLLLNQISQQLADMSNGVTTSIPPYRPFSPTTSALRVNAFWFLSLCFGLMCALAATLVQQWARHYLQAIERRPAPHKKARIRAYLYQGIESFGMRTVVEMIPTLMHIAVFLFFAGLVDFLFAINPFVAKTTLGIVAFCPALYTFITFLPIFRPDSPYKSPLSGIFWRVLQFLGLLRYTDSFGTRNYIEGSMEQGRELLATQELPGRHQRDADALSWTMESLTDNIELEPFVEGIPAFISCGQPTAYMMRQLVTNKDTALMDRISRLLMTCIEPGVLTEDRRRKRSITCLNAISSLITITPSMFWVTTACSEDLAWKLKEFHNQSDAAFRSSALAAIDVVATHLQSQILAAIWFENPKARGPMPSNTARSSINLPEEVTQGTLAKGLRVLHILDSMDGLIEIIPAIIPTIEDYGVLPLTEVLLARCQYFHIPQLLAKCKDTPSSNSSKRHRRALACLKASSAMASYNFVHSTTAETIPAFIKDEAPDIAHFANCTIARLACHLQSNIVDSILESSNRVPSSDCLPNSKHANLWESCQSMAGHYRKLNALGVMNAFTNNDDKELLLRALRLGFNLKWSQENPDGDQDSARIEDFRNILPTDDICQLERLELRTSRGKQLSQFAITLKITLNRGHIAVLIAFISFIANSAFPTFTALELIAETLHFLTPNLSARFVNRRTQALLVDSVRKCVFKLHADIEKIHKANSSDKDVAHGIINMLLAALETTGDPNVIADAQVVLTDYLDKCDPDCKAAMTTLQKLKATRPLVPFD